MNINKLKKSIAFSLIVIMLSWVVLYPVNNYFNISGFINSKIQIVKEKEMKYIYGGRYNLGDKYADTNSIYSGSNMNYQEMAQYATVNSLVNNTSNKVYMLNQYVEVNSNLSNFLMASQTENIFSKLENQVDLDSFRHKNLGIYYVFNFDYTINAIKELDYIIQKTAIAQKVPKALVAAVIFREMMFLGQEDLLDGAALVGGESIGICQIGVENVRNNELTVHGGTSVIAGKTDEEIKAMLQNPEHAVYFCAVQLKARAIKITKDQNVDLNDLTEEQMKKILEGYNQSKITKNLGPIKTKVKYAEETYMYYLLLSEYYSL